LTFVALFYLLTLFSSFSLLSASCHAGFTGVSPLSLQPDDDPLMTAVNLLKKNWISIQETFELVTRVLSRLFVGLWPKKKAEVPKDNFSDLAKSFDTVEDPILQLKGLSLKRGVEGAIALSFAHGADFDWEKVSSPHGRTRDEMKVFIEKAKKLAPALAATMSPSASLMTHKYRGCIVVLSINKSVEPNEAQKVLMSSFDQGITVNTSKQVFRGIW
jgi:hypothetical protein